MKDIQWKKMLLGFLLIAGFSLVAQAQDRPQRGKTPPTAEEIINQMDVDKDGKLSKAEVKGPLLTNFEKIDTDEDGYLTKEEIEKAPKPKGDRPPRNK